MEHLIGLALAWFTQFPPDTDVMNFPPHAYTKHALACNTAHWDHLNECRRFYGSENFIWVAWCLVWNQEMWNWHVNAMSETRVLREPWSLLFTAQTHDSRAERWCALWQLRELIGWEKYYRGQMWPPLPFWRMSELDQ